MPQKADSVHVSSGILLSRKDDDKADKAIQHKTVTR